MAVKKWGENEKRRGRGSRKKKIAAVFHTGRLLVSLSPLNANLVVYLRRGYITGLGRAQMILEQWYVVLSNWLITHTLDTVWEGSKSFILIQITEID